MLVLDTVEVLDGVDMVLDGTVLVLDGVDGVEEVGVDMEDTTHTPMLLLELLLVLVLPKK